jgi:REP element-mobilizing transposase RayT
MAHTYVSSLVHCVFSTKERRKTIGTDLRERLWAFMGGIARNNNFKTLAIGGTDDHVHLLLSLPATINIAKAVQLIKGSSSKWVHENFPQHKDFAWQEGYGAFSLSISHIDQTIKYISSQQQHHRSKTFEMEFISFLQKHNIEFDETLVWG